ncbi:MAG: hypothetical protein NC412_14015 [Roseburia sp.]|nr:hypothetical protein [Roseburia sp.]MCM1279851.1 hypothetical protein [Robinsoniella sp.]
MTKKKNGFLTFIFSLIPGAGEMFMGFFKQGISIMCIFWGVIAISSYFIVGPLTFLLPIIWFYSFFHVHNLASLSDEEFYAVEDKFLFDFDENVFKKQIGTEKPRKILAVILIVFGSYAIWDMFMNYIRNYLGVYFETVAVSLLCHVLSDVPRFAFSIAVILAGVYLIKGKKKELDKLEEASENTSEKEEVK